MVREIRGLSQENVADMLGIAQSTYSQYEGDKISITAEMLEKIAKVLGVSPLDLMSQQPMVIHMPHNQGTQAGYVKEFNSGDKYKELYEELIRAKDETIASKNAEIERLQKIVEKLLESK